MGKLSVCLVLLLAACASDQSAQVYKPGEAQQEARVRAGRIESVRPVKIQQESELGKLVGAIVGGVAASSGIGRGSGSVVAGTLGATVGGAVGNAVGKQANAKDALELVIVLDSGEAVAIVQEADVALSPGQKVRIVTRGSVSRVSPMSPVP